MMNIIEQIVEVVRRKIFEKKMSNDFKYRKEPFLLNVDLILVISLFSDSNFKCDNVTF